VARDRKRAKQRRVRRGTAVAPRDRQDARPPSQPIERTDVPGALDHASADVDEFDAALVRGADGVAAEPDAEDGLAAEAEPGSEDELQEVEPGAGRGRDGGGSGGGGAVAPPAGGDGGGGAAAAAERPSGAPLRGGNRVVGFIRASWAELQRVQWPDRRQVTQATAVVLGFVAIAGAYLGAADFVAKEIVEFILG
jgi:preprotein translocase subunit SecE